MARGGVRETEGDGETEEKKKEEEKKKTKKKTKKRTKLRGFFVLFPLPKISCLDS